MVWDRVSTRKPHFPHSQFSTTTTGERPHMTAATSRTLFPLLQTRSLSGSEHHFSIHSVKIMMIIQLDTRGTLAFRINPVRARQRHLYHLEGEYGFQVNNEQLPAASVALAVLIRQGRRHGGQGEIFLPRSSFLSPSLARSLAPLSPVRLLRQRQWRRPP